MNTTIAPAELNFALAPSGGVSLYAPAPVTTPYLQVQPARSFLTPQVNSWINTSFYEVPHSVKANFESNTCPSPNLSNEETTNPSTSPEAFLQRMADVAADCSPPQPEEGAVESFAQYMPEQEILCQHEQTTILEEVPAEYVSEPVAEFVEQSHVEYVSEPVAEFVETAPVEYAAESVVESGAEFVETAHVEYSAESAIESGAEFIETAHVEYSAESVIDPVAEFAPPAQEEDFLPQPMQAQTTSVPTLLPLPGFDLTRLDANNLQVVCESEDVHVHQVTNQLASGGDRAQTFCKIFLNDLALQKTILSGLMNEPGNPLSQVEFVYKEMVLRLAACGRARTVAQMLLYNV